MKKKLTEDNVNAITLPRGKQQIFAWDTQCAGLGMRVSKTKRAWVYRYMHEGRNKRMTLGDVRDLTLTEAQQKVDELRGVVEKKEDPAVDIIITGEEPTLGDLWAKFQADYMPRRSSGHQKNLTDAWERLILPKLGAATPLADLEWEDVDRWHQAMKSTPTQANRALAALSVAMNMARRWKMIERSLHNVATDHEKHREGARKPGRLKARPFTAKEMKAIGKALKRESDPVQRVAMEVFLLTGLRPNEVCKLRWEHLGEGGVTYLGETKTGPRYAVLSTIAEHRIRTLPESSEWIFPSPVRANQPLGGHGDDHGLTAPWDRIRRASKLKLPPVYSGRHNWISKAAASEIGDDVRRLLAGHVSSGSGAHGSYLHVTEALRPMADQVAEKIAKSLHLDRA